MSRPARAPRHPGEDRRRRHHGTGLTDLGPLEQLRAGQLPRRLVQLMAGLVLFGASMACLVRGLLGVDSWDVLHAGIAERIGWSFGTVVIVVGLLVLLLWIPLRQRPGLGTVLNVIVVGLASDATLALLPPAPNHVVGAVLLVVGIVGDGIAGGLYLGSQLGPGPRDGLMTGLAARTRFSLRAVRTALEVAVVLVGFALGGPLGIGTIAYAVTIGPLTQFFLKIFAVRLPSRSELGPPTDARETTAP